MPLITYDAELNDPLNFKEGGTMYIEVDIAGSPRPSVKWSHGDHVLQESARVTMEYNDGWSFLKVKGVKAGDAGTYKVEAENSVGKDSAEFELRVLSECLRVFCLCF